MKIGFLSTIYFSNEMFVGVGAHVSRLPEQQPQRGVHARQLVQRRPGGLQVEEEVSILRQEEEERTRRVIKTQKISIINIKVTQTHA